MTEKQIEFLKSKKRYVINSGAVGSGKSYALAWKAFLFCITYPGCLYLVATQSYKQLEETAKRILFEIIYEYENKYGIHIIQKYDKTYNSIVLYNSTKILFRAFSNAQSHIDVKSLTLDGCAIDELTDIDAEAIRMLRTRLRGTKAAYQQFAGATNPDSFTNYVYKAFINVIDPDIEVIYSTTNENPYLPKEYLKDLHSNFTGQFYERYILGKWGAVEGVVYDNFNPAKHIINDKQLGELDLENRTKWTYYRSIDVGYTNPFCVLFIAYNHSTGTIVVFDEYYKTKKLAGDVAKEISGWYDLRFTRTYIDPSAPEVKAELNKYGIDCVSARNDVFAGIQAVHALFEVNPVTDMPYILISDKVKNLIMELQSYRWDKPKENKEEKEEPLKLNDHACDALRYFVYSQVVYNPLKEVRYA